MKLFLIILLTALAKPSFAFYSISASNDDKTEMRASYTPSTQKSSRDIHYAIKSNTLYDLLLIPNVGMEVGFQEHWSINVNWMYAWWSKRKKDFYWRTYGGDIELRYWFNHLLKKSSKSLQKRATNFCTGHHIGLYAQALTYDFELGGRGYQSDKWNYAIGFSYGYSHPISKKLNLDFSIGIGYLGGKYKEYLPIDQCYVWQNTKQRHWVGPTKVEISLVWLLNPRQGTQQHGHQKGGKR